MHVRFALVLWEGAARMLDLQPGMVALRFEQISKSVF